MSESSRGRDRTFRSTAFYGEAGALSTKKTIFETDKELKDDRSVSSEQSREVEHVDTEIETKSDELPNDNFALPQRITLARTRDRRPLGIFEGDGVFWVLGAAVISGLLVVIIGLAIIVAGTRDRLKNAESLRWDSVLRAQCDLG